MEEFIRKLVATADLSILSKKMVRQHYMIFSGKTSLTPEERDGINSFIDQLLQEILEGKEISPPRSKNKGIAKDIIKENKDTVLSQPTTPKGSRKLKRSLSKSPNIKNSPKRIKKSAKKRFSVDEVIDILNNSDENSLKSDKSDDDFNDSNDENDISPISSPDKNGKKERDLPNLDSSDENYDTSTSGESFSSGHDSDSEEKSSSHSQKTRRSKANVDDKPIKNSKIKNVSKEKTNKKNDSSKEEHKVVSKESTNKHARRVKRFFDTDSASELSDNMENTLTSQLKVEGSGLDVHSDSEARSSFSDSPVKILSHKGQVVGCIESTDSEDNEESRRENVWQASHQPADHNISRHAESEQVSSDSETVEEEIQIKQHKEKATKNAIVDTDTESDEDVPLSCYGKEGDKKSGVKVGKKDDEKTSENKKTLKVSKKPQNKTLEHLKRICKASGIFLRGKRSLKDCTTEKEMIQRMKEILKEAGMEGKPTLEKAEELRLMTEAAELDTRNILSDKSVVGKRKVQSLFSRRESSPSPVKKSTFSGFSHLKDLVDSDASSDD